MGLWGLNTSLARGWRPGSGDTESLEDRRDTEAGDFLRFLDSFWARQQQERNMAVWSGALVTVVTSRGQGHTGGSITEAGAEC